MSRSSMGSVWADWSWKPGRKDELARRAGIIKQRGALTKKQLAAYLRGLSVSERKILLESLHSGV